MSRKKVILSIFLMIALVLIGIVLPTIWKMEKLGSKGNTESTHTSAADNEAIEPTETVSELAYIGFDDLKEFFSQNQITDLEEQFLSYFEITNQTTISSVEFLADETSYPEKDTTLLQFLLSDDTRLPVIYSTSSGAFFFGEEQFQVSEDSRVYTRQTDESLHTVTTEEIEAMQEGGYADTSDDIITETEGNANSMQSESNPSANSDVKEVQP